MNQLISERVKTGLRALLNAEHFSVCETNLIKPLAVPIQTVPALIPVFQVMQADFTRIDDLYKNSRAAVQTKEIEHLHAYLRALFSLFRSAVSAGLLSTDAQEKAAAEILQPLLDLYKEIPGATYAQLNGLSSNFIADCAKPAYQASVTALGLDPLVARKLVVNNSFGGLIEERGLDKEAIAAKGKLADARLEMDGAIDALISSVNNAYMLNEIGAKDPALRANLQGIASIINFAIHRVKQILADRGHHSSGSMPPNTTNPAAPDTPPQNPNATPPTINPDDLNPPAVGEH